MPFHPIPHPRVTETVHQCLLDVFRTVTRQADRFTYRIYVQDAEPVVKRTYVVILGAGRQQFQMNARQKGTGSVAEGERACPLLA